MLHRACAAVIVVTGLCTGCAASSAAIPHPVVSASTGSAAASAAPSAASSAAPRVTVDERDNGTTVHVARGSIVTAVLHSTYWQFGQPSGGGVLVPIAGPHTAARPPGQGRCVPGQGCGTVTVVYLAARPGTAVVRAGRTTCGEALRCTGGQGRFAVTIAVGD